MISVFWALDWLSSMSGAKIMVLRQKVGKNSTSTKANPGYIIPMAIILQQIELESYSNPWKGIFPKFFKEGPKVENLFFPILN